MGTGLAVLTPGNVQVSGNISVTQEQPKVFIVDATSGEVSLTLPNANTKENIIYTFIKKDSSNNNVILVGTVDGQTDLTITDQYTSIRIFSDGTEWFII